MNPDWLLKHFDQIGEAPNAVPRLRRFILDLAVRGKLVEQDQADEPASELLKRIQAKKQKLIRGCGGSNGRALVITEDETPSEIPENWVWVQSTEPSVLISDKGKKLQTKDVLESGKFPVVDQGKVFIRGYCNDVQKVIRISGPIIVFGDHTRETKLIDFDFVVGADGVKLLKPIEIDPAYYFLALQWVPLNSRGYARHFKLLRASRFPLPPLAEQHRIVAKVDELVALCKELEAAQAKRERRRDRLVAATLHGLNNGGDSSEPGAHPTFEESARFYFTHLPRLVTRPEHIHQLRQTILNFAVRGKLLPQNPEDEPAPKLLHRIEAEKTRLMEDGTIRKEKPLPPVPEVELPFLLPVNWRWVRIGTLSLMTDYGTSAKSDHYEDGVPVLKMGDIQDGRVHLGGQKKVPRSSEDLPQLFLKHFDLLYNRTNSAELVGKTGIYRGEDDAYTFASYLIRIRFLRHLTSPVYANMAMNAPYFRETQIIPELKQQCGQANVNGTKLRSMIIPLPPLAEQHRIVAKVDELMALCDEMEAQITTTATTRRQLLEATLQKAVTSSA